MFDSIRDILYDQDIAAVELLHAGDYQVGHWPTFYTVSQKTSHL